jgi:hypothetical protein
MKSIALASRLAAPGEEAFVHDCDRWVEQQYCDRYLGLENLRGQVGTLRCYRRPG